MVSRFGDQAAQALPNWHGLFENDAAIRLQAAEDKTNYSSGSPDAVAAADWQSVLQGHSAGLRTSCFSLPAGLMPSMVQITLSRSAAETAMRRRRRPKAA